VAQFQQRQEAMTPNFVQHAGLAEQAGEGSVRPAAHSRVELEGLDAQAELIRGLQRMTTCQRQARIREVRANGLE